MSTPRDFEADDELVSRVLDGDATPDEQARVAADPVLAARLATFQAVARAVAEPVVASAVARERAIAAALAAVESPAAPVVALADRRRTTRWLNAAAVVAAAAAIVVALAIIIPGRSNSHPPKFNDVGQSIGGVAAGPTSTAAVAPTSGAESGTAADTGSPQLLGDLGAFTSSDDIASALRADFGSASGVTTTTVHTPAPALDSAEQSCASSRAAADTTLGSLTAVGTAVVAGRSVEVLVFTDSRGGRRGQLVDTVTCTAVGASFDITT